MTGIRCEWFRTYVYKFMLFHPKQIKQEVMLLKEKYSLDIGTCLLSLCRFNYSKKLFGDYRNYAA